MALQVEVGSEIHDLLAGVPPQSSVTIVMDRLRYHVRHVRVLKLELKKKNMILILFNPIYIIYIQCTGECGQNFWTESCA